MRPFILLVLVLNVLFVSCNEDTCSKEDSENSDCDSGAIDYSLNGLDQEDPILIQAIKDRFLVPPDPKKKLKLQQKPKGAILYGQYGQPAEVDKIFKQGLLRPHTILSIGLEHCSDWIVQYTHWKLRPYYPLVWLGSQRVRFEH
ncbi:hypothetical protein TCAL_15889, partial [Tigriopus californicus]